MTNTRHDFTGSTYTVVWVDPESLKRIPHFTTDNMSEAYDFLCYKEEQARRMAYEGVGNDGKWEFDVRLRGAIRHITIKGTV